jgi:hypothetical protein
LRWRDQKLSNYPVNAEELMVEISNPFALTAAEVQKIIDLSQKTNVVLYALKRDQMNREIVSALAGQLGLSQPDDHFFIARDGLAELSDNPAVAQSAFIPYTNKPLSWHTDGYYNEPERQIYSFILHCASPAVQGGENSVLDHELLCIALYEKDPAYLQVLMGPEVMTIPAHHVDGEEQRAEQSGPVFSVNNHHHWHMRYTARGRYIRWSSDPLVQAAKSFIQEFLSEQQMPGFFNRKLVAGEGVICNNVLHRRAGFTDSESSKRLFFRSRYLNRIGDLAQSSPIV